MVGQFSMVLACVVSLSVNTSVPCELCCFKSLARGGGVCVCVGGVHQPDRQTDISTKQETDDFCFVCFFRFVSFCFIWFCFVSMGHMALPQQGIFDLMLEFFFMMVCNFAECMFVRLKKNVGI